MATETLHFFCFTNPYIATLLEGRLIRYITSEDKNHAIFDSKRMVFVYCRLLAITQQKLTKSDKQLKKLNQLSFHHSHK